jgi:hypothetical protein
MTTLERIAVAILADLGRAAEKNLSGPMEQAEPASFTVEQLLAHFHDDSRAVH